MISISKIKPGLSIKTDGAPFLVLQSTFSKQARGGGTNNTKLKNLLTGAIIQKTFQGNEQVEEAEVGYSRAQYLYSTGGEYHFMDGTTFEQFVFTEEDLGIATKYLLDGADIDVQNYEGKPIGIKLPPKVVLEVAQTDPGVKGDTAAGGRKPATLETDLTIQVPLFINQGDKVRVNTETGEYVERA